MVGICLFALCEEEKYLNTTILVLNLCAVQSVEYPRLRIQCRNANKLGLPNSYRVKFDVWKHRKLMLTVICTLQGNEQWTMTVFFTDTTLFAIYTWQNLWHDNENSGNRQNCKKSEPISQGSEQRNNCILLPRLLHSCLKIKIIIWEKKQVHH